MLPVYKHPDSEEICIADFAKRLASGETISSVTTPAVTRSDPSGATAPTFTSVSIPGTATTMPDGGKTVAASQGVQFTVTGGTDGVSYWITIEATTSRGRHVSVDLPLVVGVQY